MIIKANITTCKLRNVIDLDLNKTNFIYNTNITNFNTIKDLINQVIFLVNF